MGGQVAEWSGPLVSPPAICRLRVQFPSLLGHVTLPTTGALVTVWYKFIDGCELTSLYNNRGYSRKLAA